MASATSTQSPGDSFFFVPIDAHTAKLKASARSQQSRAHVMRLIRQREKEDRMREVVSSRTDNYHADINTENVCQSRLPLPHHAAFKPTISRLGLPVVRTRPGQMSQAPRLSQSLVLRRAAAVCKPEEETKDNEDVANTAVTHTSESSSLHRQPHRHRSHSSQYTNIREMRDSPRDASLHRMFNFYALTIFRCAYPLSAKTRLIDMFRVAFSDPALLNVLWLLAATNKVHVFATPRLIASPHTSPWDRSESVREVGITKASTIKLLNERMKHYPTSTSEVTSIIVHKIMIAEIFTGNFPEAIIHRNGLARMVELQGGLDKVSPFIASCMLISEALIPHEKPIVPRPPFFDRLTARTLIEICHQRHMPTPQQTLPENLITPNIHPDLLSLLQRLRDLFLYADIYGIQHSTNPSTASLTSVYELKSMVIKHQIASYEPINRIESALKFGFAAFMNVTYMTMNPGCAPQAIIVGSLNRDLDDTTITFMLNHEPETLLWLAGVGSYCSLGQTHYPRFLGLLARCCDRLELRSWDGYLGTLMRFCFFRDRNKLNEHFMRIFHQAMDIAICTATVQAADANTNANAHANVTAGSVAASALSVSIY